MLAPDVLEEMARRLPAWHLEAACRDADPALFFLDRGADPAPARALCESCPVTAACLDWAIDNYIDDGILGGLAPTARRRLARERGRPPEPQDLRVVAMR